MTNECRCSDCPYLYKAVSESHINILIEVRKLLYTICSLYPLALMAGDRVFDENGPYVSTFTKMVVLILGLIALWWVARLILRALSNVDWANVFKVIFSIVCGGALLWMMVLAFLGRSCSKHADSVAEEQTVQHSPKHSMEIQSSSSSPSPSASRLPSTKPNDYLLNILANPSFSIYDFHLVGLNSSNTELLDYHAYENHEGTKRLCKQAGVDVRNAYNKARSTWDDFKAVEMYSEAEWADCMAPSRSSNMFEGHTPSNPSLKRKLIIIPLRQ